MTTYAYSPVDPNAYSGPINDADQIVGTFGTPGPGFTIDNAFVQQGDTQTVINQPGWSSALGTGINDAGQIVGEFYTSGNGQYYPGTGIAGATGFLYTNGAVTVIHDPLATPDGPNNGETAALGINDLGQIVGWYSTGSTEHGFVYASNTGTYTTLDDPTSNHNTQLLAINDADEILAISGGFQSSHYDLYDNGTWTEISDPNAANNSTTAVAINNAGLVVGNYSDASGHTHGYIYNVVTGTYTDFNYPGAADTSLSGINNNGQVSGAADFTNGSSGSFIATPVFASLSFIGPVVDAAADAAWPVTVAGTGGETGTLVFSDIEGDKVSVDVNADGKYLVNLSSLDDGSITSTLTLSDGSSTSGSNLTLVGAPLPGDAHVQLSATSTGNLGKVGTDAPSVIDASQTSGVTFTTGNGPDTIVAGPNDVVHAGTGPDTLIGANGATLYAGSGPDTLYGAPGEALIGGSGPDVFAFEAGFGANTISNFHAGNEVLQFNPSIFASYAAMVRAGDITQVGSNTVITDSAGDTVTLLGVNASSLTAHNFHFA